MESTQHTCKLSKNSNADKQRDFLCLTGSVALFVVTDDRFASHFTDRQLLFRVLKMDRGRVVI